MITTFHIHGFRWYIDTTLPLGDHTCIIGGNGSGKTHILEAIHLASGWSLQYIQAPRHESSEFELSFLDDIGIRSFVRIRREEKDIYKIQWSLLSWVKYIEQLPYRTVFVSPFDMNLFYFSPSMRRDMIDSSIERAFGQFRKIRREYDAIMRQRNALLKRIREGEAQRNDLTYWDRAFAEKAYTYHLYRMKWVDFVGEHMGSISGALPKYQIHARYTSKIQEKSETYTLWIEESVLRYLGENTERDILSGHTHIWPHLDDFTFMIALGWEERESIECSLFLSRWENKVLLLALKQIEIFFLRKYLDLPIVLLFDDIFAELDMRHAENIIRSFEADQVIMTSQRPLPIWENWEYFSCINLNTEYHTENSYKPVA